MSFFGPTSGSGSRLLLFLTCEHRLAPFALFDLNNDGFEFAVILTHLSTEFFAPCYCLLCGDLIGVAGAISKRRRYSYPQCCSFVEVEIMADSERSV